MESGTIPYSEDWYHGLLGAEVLDADLSFEEQMRQKDGIPATKATLTRDDFRGEWDPKDPDMLKGVLAVTISQILFYPEWDRQDYPGYKHIDIRLKNIA